MLSANWGRKDLPQQPQRPAPAAEPTLADLVGFSCQFKDTRKRNALKRAYEDITHRYAGDRGENIPLSWFETVTKHQLLRYEQVGHQTIDELEALLRPYGLKLGRLVR